MKLYLVRHGEAAAKEGDGEKSLTKKGMADLLKITAFLDIHADIRVQAMYHSGRLRAHQTADVLADHTRPASGVQKAEGLDPMADPRIWADRVSNLNKDIMLVGHLPHLGRLAGLLLAGSESVDPVEFQTGGIICLSRESGGTWSVQWCVIPDILK